jgi:hypothetical protein
MRALSQWLLAASAVLALSIPAQSLDRTSNIEWRTFVVQDFGTTIQYPANIFFPAGRPGKGIGQRFKSADGRANLSVYSLPNDAGETPATYLRHNLRMDRSVWTTLGLLGPSLPSRRSASNIIQPLQLFETGARCDSLFRSCVSAGGETLLARRRDTHQLVLAPA